MMGSASLLSSLMQKMSRRPYFASGDVRIGKRVTLGRNVVFNCRKVRLGDGVTIHDNVVVNSDVFELQDYGTVYGNCFFPGPGELTIGHNFWLGTGSIVDSQGGTRIGNNVGIGAYSQLWTHMAYGDVLYGCRFDEVKNMTIGQDVWFVGHCLVYSSQVGDRSMAMLGSVVTKDMEADRVYAGVPASDITKKTGPQFRPTSLEERVAYLRSRVKAFCDLHRLSDISAHVQIVSDQDQMKGGSGDITVFNVADRTYIKRGTKIEYELMRFLLPKTKFVPVENI